MFAVLYLDQAMLHELKREISLASKKNYTMEKDISNLDQKIALLIRNRISLEVRCLDRFAVVLMKIDISTRSYWRADHQLKIASPYQPDIA